jgi:4-hydroxy-tetrahydrodipicolinate synthase
MAKKELQGVLALMTKYFPSDEEGAIDEESFRNHIRWLIRKGVHAIGVNCGADFDYNDAERRRITEILVEEVNGRVFCLMGASAWDTETTIKRAKEIEEVGADGVFMTGPPLDRPLGKNPQAIVDHFKRVSDAVHIPISFYNTPGAWPGIMPPEILRKIEEAAPLVEYVKAGPREMSEYKIMADGLADSRLKIVAGKSYCNFHQLYYSWDKPNRPVGLCGYLTGVLPAEHVSMWEAFKKNDFHKAREIWNSKILPLADLVYGRAFGYNEITHPQEILKQMGVIKTSRIPFTTVGVDEYTRGEISKYLEQVKPDIF